MDPLPLRPREISTREIPGHCKCYFSFSFLGVSFIILLILPHYPFSTFKKNCASNEAPVAGEGTSGAGSPSSVSAAKPAQEVSAVFFYFTLCFIFYRHDLIRLIYSFVTAWNETMNVYLAGAIPRSLHQFRRCHSHGRCCNAG